MNRGLSAAVPGMAAGLAFCLVTAGPASAVDVSYNVTFHSQIDDYEGVNDVWGYRAPDGTELAIYGYRTGTSFVDATDPANPVEVFDLPGPQSTWRDIKTYQNYAYVVTEGSGAGTGLQIVDLTVPLAPVFVGTYIIGQFTTAHNLWIDEGAGIAYACGASPGGGMHILDLTDPVNPLEIDYFNSYYIHDLWVGGGIGYAGAITAGALAVIDLSNPASPSTIGWHTYPGATTHNAWPNSAGTHCATSDETTGGHMKIWDVSNPASVSLASQWEVEYENAIIHNILVKDDLAYISYYSAGTHIIDIADPTDPLEVGYYDTTDRTGGFDGCWGIYPFRQDGVYYASDRQHGLFILEFTGGHAGVISGLVRDASTSAPLDSVHVKLLGVGFVDLVTGGSGTYQGRISGGQYDIEVSRFGYRPDTTTVVIPEQGSVVHDVDLTPFPQGGLRLEVVRSGSLDPVAGAIVTLLDTPVLPMTTDGSGAVMVSPLPAGVPLTVRIAKFGVAVTDEIVTVATGGTTVWPVAVSIEFFDDFEADQAWTFGAPGDDATDGLWEREIPFGSYAWGIVEPEDDASATGLGYCLITEANGGNGHVENSDVDGGTTTVLSPVFDATGLGDLTLTYKRWFSNRAPTPGGDEFRADVSSDGGSTWANLETVDVGVEAWSDVAVDLGTVVTLTPTMRLRFTAEDLGTNNFVEAGVDDIEIVSSATSVVLTGAGTGELWLAPPRPNPSRGGAEIEFRLPASARVALEVFDVAGRHVATLLRADRLGAGVHRATWAGTTDAGRASGPGVYFARLAVDDEIVTRKITRMR